MKELGKLLMMAGNFKREDCLVIGGGHVATRRIGKILDVVRHITVIAPNVTDTIAKWAQNGRLVWLERDYSPGDEEGYSFIIIATNESSVNLEVVHRLRHHHVFLNVADHPEESNLWFVSEVEVSPVRIGISSSGCNPSLSKKLRIALEADLEDGGNRFIQYLQSIYNKSKD